MDLWRERKRSRRLNVTCFLVLAITAPCSCFPLAGFGGEGLLQVRGTLEANAYTRSSLLADPKGDTDHNRRERGVTRSLRRAKGRRQGAQACNAGGMSMFMSTSTISGVRSFFSASSISAAMNAANNISPMYYFLYLLAAGVGMPVSEDALLIFIGTLLGNPDFTRRHKAACVAWCYAGVVLSDLVTYSIGNGFRRGLFNPLRRILLKDLGETVGDDDATTDAKRAVQGGSKDILERIRRSGRYVGVVERFAVGARGPMTLLCGFTGVPLRGFAAGVALGALFGTMPIQLALGYALRDRPAAVAAIGTAFVSFYVFGPPLVAAVGGTTLWLGKRKGVPREDGKVEGEHQGAGRDGGLELGTSGTGIYKGLMRGNVDS